jgi:DNA-directed RNA polymerase subunit RPC12/RpoP
MTVETMRYVPEDHLEGKHVVKLEDAGTGPFTYECSACRKPVLENHAVRLVNVVLQCPHCGAYNEALADPGVPT